MFPVRVAAKCLRWIFPLLVIRTVHSPFAVKPQRSTAESWWQLDTYIREPGILSTFGGSRGTGAESSKRSSLGETSTQDVVCLAAQDFNPLKLNH